MVSVECVPSKCWPKISFHGYGPRLFTVPRLMVPRREQWFICACINHPRFKEVKMTVWHFGRCPLAGLTLKAVAAAAKTSSLIPPESILLFQIDHHFEVMTFFLLFNIFHCWFPLNRNAIESIRFQRAPTTFSLFADRAKLFSCCSSNKLGGQRQRNADAHHGLQVHGAGARLRRLPPPHRPHVAARSRPTRRPPGRHRLPT